MLVELTSYTGQQNMTDDFFRKITNCIIEECKKFFKRKEIHDFVAFLYAEAIDCFAFSYFLQFLK